MKNIGILLVGMKLKRGKFSWKEEKKKKKYLQLDSHFFPKITSERKMRTLRLGYICTKSKRNP